MDELLDAPPKESRESPTPKKRSKPFHFKGTIKEYLNIPDEVAEKLGAESVVELALDILTFKGLRRFIPPDKIESILRLTEVDMRMTMRLRTSEIREVVEKVSDTARLCAYVLGEKEEMAKMLANSAPSQSD